VSDEVIELRTVSEDAEDDFVSEAGVAGVKGGGASVEKVAGIAAALDELKDVEGEGACGGECHALGSGFFPRTLAERVLLWMLHRGKPG